MNDKLPAEPSADQPRWPADRSTAALATALEAVAADLRRLNLTLPASTEAHLKLHLMGGTDQVRREQIDALNAALGLGEAEGVEVGPAIHYGTGYEGVAHEGGLPVVAVAIVAPLAPPTDERDAEIARLRAELAEAHAAVLPVADPTGQGYGEVVREPEAVAVPEGITSQTFPVRGDAARPASGALVKRPPNVAERWRLASELGKAFLLETAHGDALAEALLIDARADQVRRACGVERTHPAHVRVAAKLLAEERRPAMQTRPQCTPECQSQWPTEDWMPLMHLGGCPVALAQMQSGCE